ncbi:hypothetical protein PHMEG_00035070, partial [Phytophthora megakarya]
MATSDTPATTTSATTATTERALSTPTPAPTPTSSPTSAPPIPAQLRPVDTSTEDTEAGAGNSGDDASSGGSKPTATHVPPVEAPAARDPKAPDAAEDAPDANGDETSPVASTAGPQPLALVPHSAPASVKPASSAPAASTSTQAGAPSPTTRMLDLGGTIKLMRSGVLPASHASPQGCANIKPTRAVIPPRRGLDADSFAVGVPAHAAAYRSDTHVEDGYGGVENLLDTVEEVKSQLDRELSVAADERAVRETRLTDQVQKLEVRLASATQTISRLEKAKQAKSFDAEKLMPFLHENQGSIRGRWTRLRHLLRHFERGTQPPAGWKTWLTVEAADKPYRAMPPFPNVRDDDSEASDDEEIVVSDG